MFRDAGENYTLMSIDEVLLNRGVGAGPSDVALTAASRDTCHRETPRRIENLVSHGVVITCG
jgi:hypothetical protein